MLLYSGAKWPRLALSWPAPIAPFPSAFRRKQRHPSSGNRGLFNFADLYAWYGHKLHAWDSAHVSLSLSSQTKFSGRQKGGAKAGTELIQYSVEGRRPFRFR